MSFRAISDFPGRPYLYFYATGFPSVATSYNIPSHVNANDIYDDPVFLSTNKTLAIRWRWTGSIFIQQSLPISDGRVEYIIMRTPLGDPYVYGLNDDGSFYLEAFDSTVPKDRRVNFGLAHRGKLAWVPDSRQPIPRPEDC